MTKYGYARVSTDKQHTDGQVARLRADGVAKENVYADTVTGTKASRPAWDKLLGMLKPGDELVFTKLDRIGRSLVNVIDVVTALSERGVTLRALDQGEFDTASANGKMLLGILAVLAEWERNIISERTVEGLIAARERNGGPLPGRRPSFTADQREHALLVARKHPDWSAQRIAQAVGTSRTGLYRNVPELAELRAARREAKG